MCRSAITIFPQRIGDPSSDFRVWNAQLISYAGYADPDDPKKIVGDPANVEFTQVFDQTQKVLFLACTVIQVYFTIRSLKNVFNTQFDRFILYLSIAVLF